MVNRYDLLKDNTIFRFFSFQLSNCIYKENKTFHLLTCRETALPESFHSLSKAQNIFSDADTEPHKLGKYIYGYGLHSWDTDLCQMIHVYLANYQIFRSFRPVNL